MPHKQKTTMEEKINLARACIEGKMSRREADRKANASPMTIRSWVNQYKAEGASAFLPHERNRVYSPELKREAV